MRRRWVGLCGAMLALVACRGRAPDRRRPDPPSEKAPAPPPPAPSDAPRTDGDFSPSADGRSVYDRVADRTWLADFNLAATMPLGVKGIRASGLMDYRTALRWVDALNGAAYLGHRDWALPSTPPEDRGCESHNRYSFGFGCTKSVLAEVYLRGLHLRSPAPAVGATPATVKGLSNLQPYLYWSASLNANHADTNENGYTTFSFNNGFQGSNVAKNFMYVLPMIPGRVAIAGTVYDPAANVTWLANANLAASERFGVAEIAPSGAMPHTAARLWIAALNRARHLGESRWQLPPTVATDPTCSAKDNFGFGCVGSPLGSLYYRFLGKTRGEPVVAVNESGSAGPFRHVQPYLYWACHAAPSSAACHPDQELPSHVFAWSFSFGNGFQGTTMYANELYVTAYHPGRP